MTFGISSAQPEGCGYNVTSLSLLPIILTACLTIYGEMAGRRVLVYVFKPLTTVLILAYAASLPAEPGSRYRTAVLVGLALSLAGDVFLMLPSDRFIAGVLAFLAAHVAYLAAFTSFVPFGAVLATFAAMAAFAGGILLALWTHLPPRMRPALAIYAAVLAAMAAQAMSQAVLLATGPAAIAAAGALLFVASDSILVMDRFTRPFHLARLVVLGTYYAAQVLIASSVVLAAP
jgi:uncharacterized membrane protein YhhN